MSEDRLPVTGVGMVNARGEVVLVVDKIEGERPNAVRMESNRIAVLRDETVLSVKAYGELVTDALRRKGAILVVELVDSTFIRATPVEAVA